MNPQDNPRQRAGGAGPILDSTDLAILELLTDDGRLPLTGLAQRLKIARSTVQVRLARLEAEGVIGGYTVRRGPNHPAGEGLRALVALVVKPQLHPAVSAAVARIPAVTEVLAMAGDADLVADLHASGPAELDRALTALHAIDGVVRTFSSVVLAVRPGAGPGVP